MTIVHHWFILFYFPCILAPTSFEKAVDAMAQGKAIYYKDDFETAKKHFETAVDEYENCIQEMEAKKLDDIKKLEACYEGYDEATNRISDVQRLKDNKEMQQTVLEVNKMIKQSEPWSAVQGMENIKNVLQSSVAMWKHKKKYKNNFPMNFLLHGPPGTGKTTIAKAMASEEKFTYMQVEPNAFQQKYIGSGEKVIQTVFKTAVDHAPCVIFFDEVDSFITERKEDEKEGTRSVKNTFLTEMDGANEKGVYIVAATNNPEQLDKAFLRRFPQQGRLWIEAPNDESIKALMGAFQKSSQVRGSGSGSSSGTERHNPTPRQSSASPPDSSFASGSGAVDSNSGVMSREDSRDNVYDDYKFADDIDFDFLLKELQKREKEFDKVEKDKALADINDLPKEEQAKMMGYKKRIEDAPEYKFSPQDIINILKLTASIGMEEYVKSTMWMRHKVIEDIQTYRPWNSKVDKGMTPHRQQLFREFKEGEIFVDESYTTITKDRYLKAIKTSNPTIVGLDIMKHKDFHGKLGRTEMISNDSSK